MDDITTSLLLLYLIIIIIIIILFFFPFSFSFLQFNSAERRKEETFNNTHSSSRTISASVATGSWSKKVVFTCRDPAALLQ